MMWWGPSWSGMLFWPIIPIIMMIVIVVCVGMMMSGGGMKPPWRGFSDEVGKSPRDVLDERYARGDLDRTEYESKRHDLAA